MEDNVTGVGGGGGGSLIWVHIVCNISYIRAT